MATKSRKYKSYRTKWKVLATCVFFLCVSVIFFCGVVFSNVSRTWNIEEVVNQEEYYDTQLFHDQFFYVMDCVVGVHIYYQNEENISQGNAINREDLINGFKQYYWINDGIITANTEINDTYDDLIVTGEIPASLQANFEEYRYLVQNSLPIYYDMTIETQLDDYRAFKRYLDQAVNFYYYIENADGNLVAGNIDPEVLRQMPRTIVASGEFTSDSLSRNVYYNYSNSILTESGCKIYAAIADPLQQGDEFFQQQQDFSLAKESIGILFTGCVISALLAAACVLYLIRVAGQKERGGEVHYMLVDRVYNELHFLMMLLLALFSVIIASNILNSIWYLGAVGFWAYILTTILGIVYLIDAAAGLSYILSITRQIKGKRLLRNTLISVLIRRIASLFTGKTFRGGMIFVMFAYWAGNCVLTFFLVLCLLWGNPTGCLVSFGILVFFNLFCLYLFLRALRSLKHIMISARETSKGNLDYQIDLAHISPSFLNFAEDIANIQDGLKNAVDKAVKGERMKTELITNVSHDLKTPLTSIITYADLLHKESLQNSVADSYVQVIYEKSYRLKQLIEDLIEASKASSGNLKVVKMCLDLREVTMQAVGEMEEKIEDAGLEMKLSCPEPVYIDGDGRHMWRILENLLSNTVKYAMPHSRVYVDIYAQEDEGVLVMKNISDAPMDFDASTLTERFVRGDASRTTEGSGLGLSITQSLAELQGGTFCIQVDGDLFKAIVTIPLWRDPQTGELLQEKMAKEAAEMARLQEIEDAAENMPEEESEAELPQQEQQNDP